MITDTTFITNENGQTLQQRFGDLIKHTKLFDCLIGYFFASGFYAIYKYLEDTDKIRILIGISTDKKTHEHLKLAKNSTQLEINFSSKKTKDCIEQQIVCEMEEAEDNELVEDGIHKFIEWILTGKLQIRAYPNENIHAKVYIMTFNPNDRDTGRVITGSSNFTKAGFIDNLEFNVELKYQTDYQFALDKFNELWDKSIDVDENFVETIRTKTWLSDTITPFDLYLKCLYEYFKDYLKEELETQTTYLPEDFMDLKYQRQAVTNAKKILDEYGGVFISDVVGLGKTYITAMLIHHLKGRTLVLAPPVLLEKSNPGSWPNVFHDFWVKAEFESIGKLDYLVDQRIDKYENIIIDESHRFRNESNTTYETLAEICRGKKVILVTATPYNNSPKDILSQIKLFQKSRKSTIPGLADIEKYFNLLDKRLNKLDRKKDYVQYIQIVKDNAREIREKVLKYIMVRRTRSEIEKYFAKDLIDQKLKFPKVEKPEPVLYQLNDIEDAVFMRTVELIVKEFNYSRYSPLLYFKGAVSHTERLAQQNMRKFMKILLIKRLDSSFFAFRQSIDRFIASYQQVIKEYDIGNVYLSKKNTSKLFELLARDDDEAVEKLIATDKAERFDSYMFKSQFREDLEADLATLIAIRDDWKQVNRDPKLITFIHRLKIDHILKKHKLIVFTESKETADYLAENLDQAFPNQVLCYTGSSQDAVRVKVIENFDAKARNRKDDYRILICTEILSEGVNLHRSNVVINYDIPWNPTRMMQRVGRVNRVDTKFDRIFSYNFFPTIQSNDQIKLKEAAEAKIHAFIELLGADAQLLTDNEAITSHEIWDSSITSKLSDSVDSEDDNSELKYYTVIKDIQDNKPEVFDRIKRIPKKARTACKSANQVKPNNGLLTYIRRGKVQKFYIVEPNNSAKELDFMTAASILDENKDAHKLKLDKHFFSMLDLNKNAFDFDFQEQEEAETSSRGGRDAATKILSFLRASIKDRRQLTDDQEQFLDKIISNLREGGLPKNTTKNTLKALNDDLDKHGVPTPLKVMAILEKYIPYNLLIEHYVEKDKSDTVASKREIILSEYIKE